MEKGKIGQEMGKAEKNPSKRIAGDDARGKRVTLKVSADKIRENWSKNGHRPWKLTMYTWNLLHPSTDAAFLVVPRLSGWRLTWAMGIQTGKGLVPSTINVGFVPLHGEGNDNPLQYSCLGNTMGRAWRATVHGVTRVGHNLATK